MITNEFEFDETVTTVMCEQAIYEDVQIFIDDNEVFIRQWNDNIDRYDLISMSHQMFFEFQQAMQLSEGMFKIETKLT